MQDKQWAQKYADLPAAEYIFVAPTLEGQLVGEELRLDYDPCTDLAWSMNKIHIRDRARKMAAEWFELESVQNISGISRLTQCLGYPLLLIQHSYLTLSLIEVVEAWSFINLIMEKHKPDEIICGFQTHPFAQDKDRLYFVTGSTGMEFEAIKVVAGQKGIPLTVERSHTHQKAILKNSFIIANLRQIVRAARFLLKTTPARLNAYIKNKSGYDVLLNCMGGYYFDQIKPSIFQLAEQGKRLIIIIVAGQLSDNQKQELKQRNIDVFDKSGMKGSFFSIARALIHTRFIQQLIPDISRHLQNNHALKSFFSDEYGCFYDMAYAAIGRELTGSVPLTLYNLLLSEALIKKYMPKLVVSQFDLHPTEISDVLPARKIGIRTLGMNHGVCGYTNVDRHEYGSEFLVVESDAYRDALVGFFRVSTEKLFSVGDLRIDNMQPVQTKAEHKVAFKLDPDRPVCIFCDNSSWRQTNEWRNSELATLRQIIKIKSAKPELQLIYRVHHGADSTHLERYIKQLDIEGVFFQISPNPPFSQIIHAADVLISHYSSAIAESLASGVPVIYLCALSEKEPNCVGYQNITVVEEFKLLESALDAILGSHLTPVEIRKQSQDYMDKNLHGNDGAASERLAKLIRMLAELPAQKDTSGFSDWERRIRESNIKYRR